MAEPSRLKRKRTANRKVLLDLLKQAKDITMEEELTDDLKHSLEAIMSNVNKMEKLVKTLDEELVNIVNEEDIDDDIEKATEFEIQVSTKINEVKSFIKKHTNETEKGKVSSMSSRSPVIKPNINLPNLVSKKSSVVTRSCGNSFTIHLKPPSIKMRI